MSVRFRGDSLRNVRLKERGITPPASWDNLAELRRVKHDIIAQDCTAAIYAGVDVEGKHYSLQAHDQTEIMTQLSAVREGAQAVPYHADGEVCRMYPAQEFAAVAAAAQAHILYHRTYCNHMFAWIRRATRKQLEGIFYGAELPQDLKDSMAALMGDAAGE